MRYKIWSCVLMLLASALLFGCANEALFSDMQMLEAYASELAKNSALQDGREDEAPRVISHIGMRIADKKKENPDSIGWLTVPGTDIDSVIVQNPKGDNNYYTTHDFYGRESKTAAYGADWRIDFSSATRRNIPSNMALYGHSFDENPNGELFSQLKKFKNPEFAREHPYIYFSTEEEDMVWEIFAVYDAIVSLPYIVPDLDWDTLSGVLEVIYEASLYDYGIEITDEDKLLTLSCCTFSVPGRRAMPFDIPNSYRFVVMARLLSPDEKTEEYASFEINNNPLPPDDMPMIFHAGNDAFLYNGFIYFNVSEVEAYKRLDLSKGVAIGEIERTGITVDLQDWDAVSLEVGTEILRYPGVDEILLAIVDGVAVPYFKYEKYK